MMKYYLVYYSNSSGLVVDECRDKSETLQKAIVLFAKYESDRTFQGVYVFVGNVTKAEFPPDL